MARRVTSMSLKVTAAVVAVAEGEAVNVLRLCREAKRSRKTFFKWLARYRAEGFAGLEERSRRPAATPHRVAADVEDEVVRRRKALADRRSVPFCAELTVDGRRRREHPL
jgi:transposase